METFRSVSKAIAGFIVGLVTYVTGRVTMEGAVIPDFDPFDTKGWLLLAGSMIVGYVGVYLAPANQLNPKQIGDQVERLPKHRRDETVRKIATAYPPPVPPIDYP